ncbi:hypothetical protein MPH_04800 [Macrophomina phaseolina MS6]|uniref:Uncharacterized protein n=1 Tax=Macrophomina phaseolina (strain MS6) TaxID=1126212 RepID=K2RT67_MACPH|nr:hypothetical protein MPH_04800 [Macrophomina phaseolina MS6]
MLRTLARRAAEPPRPAFDIHNNPYKAKRLWPPDFSKLPPKHQFRLERKYRRRSQLKWARPRWNKFVKLAQWATISCGIHNAATLGGGADATVVVVVYGVLFMDWRDEVQAKGRSRDANAQPFQGIRDWYRRTVDSIWSKPAPQPDQPQPSSPTA